MKKNKNLTPEKKVAFLIACADSLKRQDNVNDLIRDIVTELANPEKLNIDLIRRLF